MPSRIREETDDVIILDKSKFSLFTSGIFTLILILWALFLINQPSRSDSLFIIILIVGSGLGILKILSDLQVIIINKKSQSVAFFRLPYALVFIKEIPFSDIERIQKVTNYNCETSSGSSWSIDIITNQGDSIEIYNTRIESDAEIVEEKISKITCK